MKIVVNNCSAPRGEIKINGDKSITHRGLIILSIGLLHNELSPVSTEKKS